jgi:hypothetical protein
MKWEVWNGSMAMLSRSIAMLLKAGIRNWVELGFPSKLFR